MTGDFIEKATTLLLNEGYFALTGVNERDASALYGACGEYLRDIEERGKGLTPEEKRGLFTDEEMADILAVIRLGDYLERNARLFGETN